MKKLKIYDIIAQWLTHYKFNFSQLGKKRNDEEIEKEFAFLKNEFMEVK